MLELVFRDVLEGCLKNLPDGSMRRAVFTVALGGAMVFPEYT